MEKWLILWQGQKTDEMRDFLGGPVIKTACHWWGRGFEPRSGKTPRAEGRLSPRCNAWEPQRLEQVSLEPTLRKRSRRSGNPLTTTRGAPPPKLDKARAPQRRMNDLKNEWPKKKKKKENIQDEPRASYSARKLKSAKKKNTQNTQKTWMIELSSMRL